MRKVLITGAAGFIGYSLGSLFFKKGYDVIGWDCVNQKRSFTIKQVDLNDEKAVIENLKIDIPDIIIHCAGSADVGKSVKNPELDYVGNVTLTHNLLFAIHKVGLKKVKFVFLSSASVYGNPINLPITEDCPLNPLSPYAIHKLMCEELCKYFVKNYEMDIKIARIFSAYGTGLKKQIFWDMHEKYRQTGKLEMYGTGNESRDYIHIDDVINALFLLATIDSKYIFFNIANGEEITIRQAAECFAECNNITNDKLIFNGIVREGDPLNWRADITRIKSLGYRKSIDMKNGMLKYSEWANSL